MKKLQLLLIGVLFLAITNLSAQENPLLKETPLNPNVRYGVLSNGMTYYIQHNEEPKNRASFYIIQNVGAILENDSQDGLAHFLEHMAFNGTEHFEGKGIINYLQSKGVAFGRDINAYTSLDETVYNLSKVPNDEAVMDSCLLILNDWSNFLLLTTEEINNERGVITEEWRTRRNADFRMNKKLAPVVYGDSKYAKRDVIGNLDVIKNFDPKVIKEFYNDYYRTDLQAIAIVGDFDAEKMEQKVKKLFSKIPAVKNPKERVEYAVPDHKDIRVGIATDPEATKSSFTLFCKHNTISKEDKGTLGYLRHLYARQLFNSIISQRMSELTQKENPPFIFAVSSYFNLLRTKDVFYTSIAAKSDAPNVGFKAAIIENERIKRYGVTASELDRAKVNFIRGLEKSFNERNKISNDNYAKEYARNFLDKQPAPGIEFEYQFAQMMLPTIEVEELNAYAKEWISNENLSITYQGPEKEGVKTPTEKEILDIIEEVKSMDIEPYVDKVSSEPLIENEPKGSKVVSTKQIENLEATQWILENGAKIIYKYTDHKKDQVLMKAYSKGGQSLLADKDIPSAKVLSDFIGAYGLGKFDNIALQKMLAGKVVKVSPFIKDLTEGFSGSCSPKDFETMMQMLYLYFTNPRFDAQAHAALYKRFEAYLANMASNPNAIFQKELVKFSTKNNPRARMLDSELLKEVNLKDIERIYRDRFKDASDFTFIFVGNLKPEEAKPVIEKYIGAIANENRKENFKDNHIESPKGKAVKDFEINMQTAKTKIFVSLHGDYKYSRKANLEFAVLSEILSLRYTESIREREGGTYGVSTSAYTDHYPTPEYSLIMTFDCDPEKADHLKKIIYEEIQTIAENGPTSEDLTKTIKNMQKNREESLTKNGFWMAALYTNEFDNIDISAKENFTDILNNMKAKNIKKLAKKLLKKANNMEVIMRPDANSKMN